jgi:hypothetical protein
MNRPFVLPHPRNEEYFSESHPHLFHAPDGSYRRGLAELFGAHLCGKLGETKYHAFVDNKCADCGQQRRKT